MIYTCYDMIRDCRADRAEGWSHFVSQYVPVVRRILSHYWPEREGNLLRPVLETLRRPQSSLFASLEPAPERWFVAELRRQVLAAVEQLEISPPPAAALDLDTLAGALSPLTLTEKQAAWMETMRYTSAETGTRLRMEPRTVEKIRDKAAELLRGRMDTWSQSLLAGNGRQLGLAAEAAATNDCLPAKAFLDILDGRTTWYGRETLERHVSTCWHCIDHFCRMVEVRELLRGVQPLTPAESLEFQELLGIRTARKAGWKRLFGTA
jgi:hypothetical protein